MQTVRDVPLCETGRDQYLRKSSKNSLQSLATWLQVFTTAHWRVGGWDVLIGMLDEMCPILWDRSPETGVDRRCASAMRPPGRLFLKPLKLSMHEQLEKRNQYNGWPTESTHAWAGCEIAGEFHLTIKMELHTTSSIWPKTGLPSCMSASPETHIAHLTGADRFLQDICATRSEGSPHGYVYISIGVLDMGEA